QEPLLVRRTSSPWRNGAAHGRCGQGHLPQLGGGQQRGQDQRAPGRGDQEDRAEQRGHQVAVGPLQSRHLGWRAHLPGHARHPAEPAGGGRPAGEEFHHRSERVHLQCRPEPQDRDPAEPQGPLAPRASPLLRDRAHDGWVSAAGGGGRGDGPLPPALRSGRGARQAYREPAASGRLPGADAPQRRRHAQHAWRLENSRATRV
ncbi:hypothetical protein T484DRAFT_1885809, partial [Baffinella frigidus]